ncbi:amidase [Streptomyces sp. AK010]|uniref:amidase n=1 Tax=Streptomyces sp. AK010 TaxID=2723074 RepID=UPI001613FDD0|nr:amidase [Streptomyces sp. AK010]MBB6419923.1 Asp-tRNA(Asn)/Glu-tRNA(Gln) amidotransferase A subunit family amidase [Streptomyces sp. AK010]
MSDTPTAQDAITAYARQARWTTPASRPSVPGTPVRMSLPERVTARSRCTLTAEEWRTAEAAWSDEADARYRACVQRAPLGPDAPPVRVGVKDTVDVAGFPTRLGLRGHRHHARLSTPAISALPPELASVTAKVVTTELNIGVGSECVNPYVPHIDPGGSSTGTAVSVAAGICDLALGTDVLGSVRWPAGQCGTVGLRMTHRSSLLEGVFPLSPPMDALGWAARSAADLAYLWPLLGLDRLGAQRPPGEGPYRIGVVANTEGPEGTCGPVMRGALETACGHLEASGHLLDAVRVDDLWALRGPAWELCARQAWDAYQVWRPWVPADLHETTRGALEVGAKVQDDRYAWILERLAHTRATVEGDFDAAGVDAWLLPLDPAAPPDLATAGARVSTIPAPQDPDYDVRVAYTPLASFAGLPALTMPVARDERGAPLCVQLIARRDHEPLLIRLAALLEEAVGPLGLRPS